VPVGCPLHEDRGWRFDLDELESLITLKTRAIYINSPHNPTGGVLTRTDLERIAALVRDRDIWLVSDEAYEHVLFDGVEHVSPASLPGMYERTIPVYTFSKSYAATGLRLGYLAVKDERVRERLKKALFYTTSNVSSIVQFGAIGALEGSQACIEAYRDELQARRNFFYDGLAEGGRGVLAGAAPKGAFYAFVRIASDWHSPDPDAPASPSWAMAQHLITRGRIGCVPGVDFGAVGEGYLRFCFARDRRELGGALESLQRTLSAVA
jgi:aspartate aminotransferase